MVSTYNAKTERRIAILEQFNKTYKPFFEYQSEVKKDLFRITFSINGQDRIVRADPQFVESELEDLIATVESAKDAIVTRVRSEAIKEATEKFREKLLQGTYNGHKIKWTYAFELDDMEGFVCPDDKLFLPVEYDDIYELNSYRTEVHADWEEKALKYFADNFGKQTFVKRQRCPDSLKDFVVEFAAAQKMIFTNHDRYICQVQQEYIPDVDKCVRWHFEFGDFIEKDGSWEYVKDTGIYSMYDNDVERYMYLYNSLCEAIPEKEVAVTYIEGPGLYYGTTKMRISVGPWYKEIEITPDMNNWESTVVERLKKESSSCQTVVWDKVSNCLNNFLCKDIAELVSLHEKIGPATIAANLMGKKKLYPDIKHSGAYDRYAKEEIDNAISALITAKILKKEKYEKDGKTYLNIAISQWGLSMLRRYKKTLSDVDSLADKAKADIDSGKNPGDEEAYAFLKLFKAKKAEEKTPNDIEYINHILKCKNVMNFYSDTVNKILR